MFSMKLELSRSLLQGRWCRNNLLFTYFNNFETKKFVSIFVRFLNFYSFYYFLSSWVRGGDHPSALPLKPPVSPFVCSFVRPPPQKKCLNKTLAQSFIEIVCRTISRFYAVSVRVCITAKHNKKLSYRREAVILRVISLSLKVNDGLALKYGLWVIHFIEWHSSTIASRGLYLSCIISKLKRDICWKMAIFHIPHAFDAPLSEDNVGILSYC